MTLLFGFAPFILFAILSRLSADLALWLAFAAAFVVTIRDFVESPSLRLLDGASLTLFGLLALWRGFVAPELVAGRGPHHRRCGPVPGDLCSLLRRQPFSLQYASRDTKDRHWPLPVFLRVNYVISLVWGLTFAAMALADGAVTFLSASFYVGIAVNVVGALPRHHLHPALSRAGGRAAGALTSLRSRHPLISENIHETSRHRLHGAHRPRQIGARRLQPDPWRGDGRPCRQARHRQGRHRSGRSRRRLYGLRHARRRHRQQYRARSPRSGPAAR